ncbi:MAG: hypothetical protein E5Y04_09365 [Mesorhizobium sp.]|nr:MAG: hypothetical protein E5Y04_09365 [Mesorhizobium sp.]
MVLAIADQNAISLLVRANVEATTIGLKPFIKKFRWIGKTNHYASNVVRELDVGPPATNVRKRNLAQYIAASTVLHANDGWSYLGRSIACLMVGDAHRALHLAYYAELRAGMSLLAGAGVGIFNNKHYVISAPNATAKLSVSKGTHHVVWMALEHWSKQPASGILFSRLIRPEGISLDDWFVPIGGSAALAPQARDWFMQWGMDLNLATSDRQARNESSYRPDGIPLSWEVSSAKVLEFTKDLWSTLEPSDQSSFEQIDRYILRLALEKQFRGVFGSQPNAANPTFVSHIQLVVQAQGLSPAATKRWEDFLLRRTAAMDPQIFANSTVKPTSVASDPMAVLSRAVLLLRVATGSAHDLLKQASFDANALAFWWKSIGIARGLWEPAVPPTQLSDLWADIRDMLLGVDDTNATDPGALSSINGLGYGMSGRLNMLCSHERVGLWGLCPA